MKELIFTRDHALEAIRQVDSKGIKGIDWLYGAYPKYNGRARRSSSGFLLFKGKSYPIKPLARLANELAGLTLTKNYHTHLMIKYFLSLNFKSAIIPDNESKEAAIRQKRLAEVWNRPGQAEFRRRVFEVFDYQCIITGCQNWIALEVAHLHPVHRGGSDYTWNGIPLRADIHRLFDANVINIDPLTWEISVKDEAGIDYLKYDGINLKHFFEKHPDVSEIISALQERGAAVLS